MLTSLNCLGDNLYCMAINSFTPQHLKGKTNHFSGWSNINDKSEATSCISSLAGCIKLYRHILTTVTHLFDLNFEFYQISPVGDKSCGYPLYFWLYPRKKYSLAMYPMVNRYSQLNPKFWWPNPQFLLHFPTTARYTWIEHQIGWDRVRQNDAPVRGIQTGTGCLAKRVSPAIFGRQNAEVRILQRNSTNMGFQEKSITSKRIQSTTLWFWSIT